VVLPHIPSETYRQSVCPATPLAAARLDLRVFRVGRASARQEVLRNTEWTIRGPSAPRRVKREEMPEEPGGDTG